MRAAVRVAAVVFAGAAVGAHGGRAQEPRGEVFTLDRAMRTALANSRVLEGAEFGLREAAQQVREAWGTAMPDVSANLSYSRSLLVQEIFLPARFIDPNAAEGELTPIRVGSDNSWQAGLTASQPIFQFDVFVGVGAAGRYKALQEEVVRGTAQQVVTAVRQAYFAALLAAEDLRLTGNSIARVGRTLEETRALNRQGLTSDYDVLRLEVQYANIEAGLRRSQNAAAAAKRALLIEMGLDPTTPIQLEGQLYVMDLDGPDANDPANAELLRHAGAQDLEERSFEALYDVALQRRTDLRQLRSAVLLEEARAGVERAQFYPKLSAFSNYSVSAQGNGAPGFFDGQRTSMAAAGLRVELPVFRGFGRFARVEQAQARARQNEATLRRTEQEALNQLRTVLDALDETRLRAASQRRAVEQAERGFAIASAEYREGVGSQLQVTDAEVALRQSEYNYAQAVYDYLSARAQLELTVGLVPDGTGTADGDEPR